MLSIVSLSALLAALVAASPYPPEATTRPPTPKEKPHFGNVIHANITDRVTGNASGNRLATGQFVWGGAARYDTNIYDGIGPGADFYRMYWGDGGYGHGW